MFGGIVETTGKIIQLQRINGCLELAISSDKNFDDLSIGDSVAVNGACLTVIHILNNKLSFTAVPETLRLTNLDFLMIGNTVNLERSLAANSRIGGHYVQGHVDFCGQILDFYNERNALIAEISYPKNFGKYIVDKGFVALDGMSITIINVKEKFFRVTFIPHTQQNTIVNQYKVKTKINVEVDMMGKYIEKFAGVYLK